MAGPVARRAVLIAWLVFAVALWNGIFEIMVLRGVKEYLFRAELYDAGRMPFTPIADIMAPTITYAGWVASIWTAVVFALVFVTFRVCRATAP